MYQEKIFRTALSPSMYPGTGGFRSHAKQHIFLIRKRSMRVIRADRVLTIYSCLPMDLTASFPLSRSNVQSNHDAGTSTNYPSPSQRSEKEADVQRKYASNAGKYQEHSYAISSAPS